VPLQSNWSLYGKAGLARSDTTFSANSATAPRRSRAPAPTAPGCWSAWARCTTSIAACIRAGWDHYANVGDDATGKGSINTFNVGIGMRF